MKIGTYEWHMIKLSETWRRNAIVAIWIVSSATLAWQLIQGQHSSGSQGTPVALLVLLVCTISMRWWLPNPIKQDRPNRATRTVWLVLISTVAIGVLVLLTVLFGPFMLLGFPIVAVTILLVAKQPLAKREWMYALGLAFVAGVAGLDEQFITFITPVQWGILQLPLVLTGFLAGWSILRYSELLQRGVGRSRFLSEGVPSAARGFVQGILIAMPWALAAVVMGTSERAKATWVQSWWQPFIAIRPGIAEEAWGRILPVPLLFQLLRRFTSTRVAFTTALVIIGYWFAYLHTYGDPITVIVSTLITGPLFVLPLSFLCFYRDLETAIGFHFWADFLKYGFGFNLFNR